MSPASGLEVELGRRESAVLEFKRQADDLRAVRKAVCALANDPAGAGGGDLVIGVDDAGCGHGTDDSDDALLSLSRFEERLSQEWSATLAASSNAAVRTTTALHRLTSSAAAASRAEIVLLEVGPSLGALNRAALLTADHVLIPLGADLFGVQGLRNLGPSQRRWRSDWQDTALPRVDAKLRPDMPSGAMQPLGYVVMQPSMRLDRPVAAYQLWLHMIPAVYAEDVLNEPGVIDADAEIATVRNFRSLMPLAHDARKPTFDRRAADGAVGSTQRYVATCFTEFRLLTEKIKDRLEAATVLSGS